MPTRLAAVILLSVALLFGLAAAAADAPPSPDDPRPKLDAAESTLKQIDASLHKKELKSPELQALRAQIDPIAEALSAIVAKLGARLEAFKRKLAQFGPVPPDKAKADAEAPATAEGRKAAQKAFDEANVIFRRAHSLDDEASHLERVISAKRRAVFTRALFERAPSLLSPAAVSQLAGEIPGNLNGTYYLLVDSWQYAADRITSAEAVTLALVAALVVVLYLPARRLSRRFFTRRRAATDVPRLTKVLAAIRIALATAIVPIVAVGVLVAALRTFDLLEPRIQPIVTAMFDAVARVFVAIGLARAVLAPSRPNWRLIALRDDVAWKLRGTAVMVVGVNALQKVVEALNDGVAATLPVSVATRAAFTLLAALLVIVTLLRIERSPGRGGETATAQAPQSAPEDVAHHWWGLLNLAAWAVMITIVIAALGGYVAFAAYTVDQLISVAAIGAILYLLLVVADEGIPATLSPGGIAGRMLMSGIGMRPETVGQAGVLLSGVLRLLLIVVAILLVVAPWGLQSDDIAGYLRTAFFGFSVGGLRISPVTIAVATALFLLALLASRGVRNWLATKYLPHTRLGAGLQNSILTSLGYVGFVVAAVVALSYVGLSFDKFAIIAGALSVGIGFGLQAIVGNFVSGLIILWERTIQVGDWVVVGNDQGYVRRVNVRSTEIETMDRAMLIVPNTTLVTGSVKNWVRGSRIGRIKLDIGVYDDADPEKVREILLRCARGHARVLAAPAPAALLVGFAEWAMRFELYAFVDDVESGGGTKSDIYLALFKELRGAGFNLA